MDNDRLEDQAMGADLAPEYLAMGEEDSRVMAHLSAAHLIQMDEMRDYMHKQALIADRNFPMLALSKEAWIDIPFRAPSVWKKVLADARDAFLSTKTTAPLSIPSPSAPASVQRDVNHEGTVRMLDTLNLFDKNGRHCNERFPCNLR